MMKRNIIKYKALLLSLIAGFLTAGLYTSCTSESILGSEKGEGESATRYIRLTLNAPHPDTRTQVPDTDDTPEESKISSVNLYLVKDGQTAVQSLGRASVVPLNDGTWEAYSYLPSDAAVGDKYYLYVVANQGKDAYSTAGQDALIGVYTAGAGDDSNNPAAPAWVWQPNRFLMTNTTNIASADAINYSKAGAAFIVSAEPKTEVTVSIERLAVKVEVDASQMQPIDPEKVNVNMGVETGKGECTVKEIKIIRTTLVNCVKQYNLVQHWGADGNDFVDDVTARPSQKWLYTPSSATTYLVDDNGYYNRLTVTTDAQGNVTGGTDPETLNGWVEANNDAGAGTKHYMYCLENNPPTWNTEYPETPITIIGTKSNGRTTAVVVEAQVIVSDETQLTDGTVYRFGDKLYTTEKAFMQEKYPDLSGTEYDEKLAQLKANRSLQTFEGGKMYYTVYLIDDRYTHTEAGVAGDVSSSNRGSAAAGQPYYYYAVFRNSWNVLTINSIVGWGDDKPTEPPTDPIDKTKLGLSTTVRANYWKIESREHTLGEGDVQQ